MKHLSPVPQLGPSSDPHTSYYSESMVRESYIGSPQAVSLARSALLDDRLHSEPYWSKCPEPPTGAWNPPVPSSVSSDRTLPLPRPAMPELCEA